MLFLRGKRRLQHWSDPSQLAAHVIGWIIGFIKFFRFSVPAPRSDWTPSVTSVYFGCACRSMPVSRLVHRLDRETARCPLVAKTRFAATALTGSFRHRPARKIYWALVAGVPKPKPGRISTYLAKEEREED